MVKNAAQARVHTAGNTKGWSVESIAPQPELARRHKLFLALWAVGLLQAADARDRFHWKDEKDQQWDEEDKGRRKLDHVGMPAKAPIPPTFTTSP